MAAAGLPAGTGGWSSKTELGFMGRKKRWCFKMLFVLCAQEVTFLSHVGEACREGMAV